MGVFIWAITVQLNCHPYDYCCTPYDTMMVVVVAPTVEKAREIACSIYVSKDIPAEIFEREPTQILTNESGEGAASVNAEPGGWYADKYSSPVDTLNNELL